MSDGAADSYATLELEIGDDHVATVTLNRPERLNAFNESMAREAAHVWDRLRGDRRVHSVVLCAAGDRAFCTGIDVKEGAWWTDQEVWNQRDPGAELGPKQRELWKPVIAAVNGICAGGAMYMINESDIVLCTPDATFFDPHANGGLVSALEPIGLLHRGVPLGDVLRWALMGTEERIGAETALRLGLVTEIVAKDLLVPRAHEIASGIARRRPEAIQGTVRAVWESLDVSRSAALRRGFSYTKIGNPPDGERRDSFHLGADPVVR